MFSYQGELLIEGETCGIYTEKHMLLKEKKTVLRIA